MDYIERSFRNIVIILIIFAMIALAYVAIDSYVEGRNEEEVINKGVNLSALVIDKKEIKESNTDLMPVFIGSTLMVIPSDGPESSAYTLKLYANDKNYQIEVNKEFFNSKTIGDSINIKLLDDRIVLLDKNN